MWISKEKKKGFMFMDIPLYNDSLQLLEQGVKKNDHQKLWIG